MFFRQLLNDDLFCASYVLADGGDAIVVDPAWDIDPYLALAAAHGFRIRWILETHTHADHVSGRGRLAAATGATARLPVGAGDESARNATRPGDVLRLGDLAIETVATPGHRPEHVSFLVTDTAASAEPCVLLSGDSLFVGDAARPDLAAEGGDQVDTAARDLHRTLRRLAELPDHVELWPGHVGGSLCGGAAMSRRTSSTIGYERRSNWALGAGDIDVFVDTLVARLPDRPPTVDTVVALNRRLLVDETCDIPLLTPVEASCLVDAGAAIVDGRPLDEFLAQGLPGALGLPLGEPGLGTRAARVIAPERPVVIVARDTGDARKVAARLAAVGLRNVRGMLTRGTSVLRRPELETSRIDDVDVATLAQLLADEDAVLVDVRDDDEYRELHVAGSLHIPWHALPTRYIEALGHDKPIAVACASGRRTAIAAGLLRRPGGPPVLRLASGGIAELSSYDLSATRAPQHTHS